MTIFMPSKIVHVFWSTARLWFGTWRILRFDPLILCLSGPLAMVIHHFRRHATGLLPAAIVVSVAVFWVYASWSIWSFYHFLSVIYIYIYANLTVVLGQNGGQCGRGYSVQVEIFSSCPVLVWSGKDGISKHQAKTHSAGLLKLKNIGLPKS